MGLLGWLKSWAFSQPETKITLPAVEEPLGLQLKQHYEGCERKLPNGLIAPYIDMRGVTTIGWGNTFWETGERVSMNDAPITQARADALAEHVWKQFRSRVAALLPADAPHRDIEVFTSLAYNIGTQAFTTSTALKKYLNGDRKGAAEGIEMWNRAGGIVPVKGLQRRRRAERLVFDGAAPKDAIKQALKDYP